MSSLIEQQRRFGWTVSSFWTEQPEK